MQSRNRQENSRRRAYHASKGETDGFYVRAGRKVSADIDADCLKSNTAGHGRAQPVRKTVHPHTDEKIT